MDAPDQTPDPRPPLATMALTDLAVVAAVAFAITVAVAAGYLTGFDGGAMVCGLVAGLTPLPFVLLWWRGHNRKR